MKTYNDMLEYIEEENIKFIRLVFFDVFGNQKNIAIMPGELRRAVEHGILFDANNVAGYGDLVKGDLFLKPDLNTVAIVPWRPLDGRVCRMFCDVLNPDGTPFTRDTRYMLKQAVKAASEKGISVNFGPEVEFYVFRRDEEGQRTRTPIDYAGYMDVAPDDRGENIRRDVCFTLLEMGITPEASHHEQGPGQNEIDFRYGDPVTSADNTTTLKWAVRCLTEVNGMWADFSPKPMAGEPGNGMHLNMSIECADGKDRQAAFMAGILDHIREITLFLDPVKDSYKRFGQMEAPRYVSWSEQNRSQLIRIPAESWDRKRIELRSPDPEANPYLAFALLIYAGLDGIERDLKPGEPVEADLYREEKGGDILGLAQLPGDLSEAVDLARKSEFVRRLVPEPCLEAYCGPRPKGRGEYGENW